MFQKIIYYDTQMFLIKVLVYVIIPIIIVFLIFFIFLYLPDRLDVVKIKKNIIKKLLNIKKYYPERFSSNSLKLYLALTNPYVYDLGDKWFNDNIIKPWNLINPNDKFDLFYDNNNYYEAK